MSWSNSGLARQLDYEPASYPEDYYTSLSVEDIYVEDQVAHNISRLRVRALGFAKLFFLLFLYGMVVVFMSNGTATLGYDVAHLEADVTVLNDQNKRLELEIASLKSLERIEQAAIAELGMVHSGRKDSLLLETDMVAAGASQEIVIPDNAPPETRDAGSPFLDWLKESLGSTL